MIEDIYKTDVFPNPAVDSMRALVWSVWDKIQWRHHGIGVLQGYVRENTDPEIRVHVWSSRLIKPGMAESGDSHDHRFDMVFHVLCGYIWHEEIHETAAVDGEYATMALTHARAASDTKYHGPTTDLPGRYHVRRRLYKIKSGQSYSFPAYQFHRSPVDSAVAVTCVEKHHQQDKPARIIYPAAKPPVMAFGHDMDERVVKVLLVAAKDLLTLA